MNSLELQRQLFAEGYSPQQFLVGALGDDVFCLIQDKNEWQVVYAERGFVREVLFQTIDETEACEFMFQYMMQIQPRP
jgi:hypothetical protein